MPQPSTLLPLRYSNAIADSPLLHFQNQNNSHLTDLLLHSKTLTCVFIVHVYAEFIKAVFKLNMSIWYTVMKIFLCGGPVTISSASAGTSPINFDLLETLDGIQCSVAHAIVLTSNGILPQLRVQAN